MSHMIVLDREKGTIMNSFGGMIVKRIIGLILFLLIVGINSVFALPPGSMSTEEASNRARVAFLMNSAENMPYNVYIVGENEKLLGSDWTWRQQNVHEEIWAGKYYAYVSESNGSVAARQPVSLFQEETHASNNNSWPPQRINVHYPNHDGFYVVKGKAGQPDILICTIRVTGGGIFLARAFVIKDGSLKLLRFMNQEQSMRETHRISFDRIYYLDDGTLAVPWWTNAGNGPFGRGAGKYTTVYMMDIGNLILISSYTNRR